MNETTQKRQGNFLTRLVRKQIFIPLAALLLLIVFNLIADPSFFAITLKENSLGDLVLTGNLITILDNASELVILAIGMTLVTAASGGQDISVGSAIAIAGSVVLRVLCGTNSRPDTLQAPIIVAFLACCVVSMLFGAFNGTLVAVFKIQPMVATLILYTAGRSIAAWINNNELPMISDPSFAYYGNFLPGVAVPTPIFIAVICMILAWALLRFTNIGPVLAGSRHQRQRRAAQRHPPAVREVPDLRHPRPVRGRGGLYQGQPLLHHQLFRCGQGHRNGRDPGRCPRRQRALAAASSTSGPPSSARMSSSSSPPRSSSSTSFPAPCRPTRQSWSSSSSC